MDLIGVIVIGRNEGDRLIRCFKSLLKYLPVGIPIVYVDSGSSDGSVAAAQSLGVQTIELDPSKPFTMARGRNTGFRYLTEHFSNIKYVQFIDGDCELLEGWLEAALATLEQDERVAIACGRRRERFPDASMYNRLADMEWNTPVGEAKACGGDALMRVQAIQEVGGYSESMICGEEPEMCIRLRQQGWTIQRIPTDMTIHDAAMNRFGQWWTRTVRGGWAVAEGFALHGQPPENYMRRQHFSGWLWGIVVPVISLGAAFSTAGLSLLLLIGYPALGWRMYTNRRKQGDPASHALLYAAFGVIYKVPQALGQMKYWLTRWRGYQATLIEYKQPAPL